MSQNDYDPDENDVRDGSMSQTTRRGLLGALGVAGLASLGSGSASAQLGGGPEADAMSEYRVPTYRVPESDLDSPGVVGRRVEITSGGSSYSAGDQLVDTGTSWERISPGYDSVSTEQIQTESRGPSVVVHVKDDGTIVADGPDAELASGDINSTSDVRTVLQSAIDNGGHIKVKPHSSPYLMNAAGDDPDGELYCLRARDYTTLEVGAGATIEYDVDTSVSPPRVASPIFVHDNTDFEVCGGGMIDAGYHEQPAYDYSSAINVMTVKIGMKEVSESSTNIVVEDLTLSGAFRHCVEAIGAADDGPERVRVEGVTFDDGSGDDDVSFSIGTRYCFAVNCWSINKTRGPNQDWTGASFESEDGATHCGFINCYSIGCVENGITIGKSHANQPACVDNFAQNCRVVDCVKDAYRTGGEARSGESQTNENIEFRNCVAYNPEQSGLRIYGGPSGTFTQKDILADVRTYGATEFAGINIAITQTLERLRIPQTAHVEADNFGISFKNTDASNTLYRDVRIEGVTVDATKDAIEFRGTKDNYAGKSYVRDCELDSGEPSPESDSGWQKIDFDDSNIRKYVRTLNNNSLQDATPVRPVNAKHGERILAEASLRSASYDGYDHYDEKNDTWREMS